MDYKQQVFSLISQFTGQNNILTVNVALVDFVGDLETSLFLSQLIYWSDRGTRKDGFFYKTDEEWHQEIRLSKYSVRKSRKKLESLGLLETVVKKANGNPTVHYKFNQERFSEMFISFLRNQKNEVANTEERSFETEISLTEITTEITTNKDIYSPTNNPQSDSVISSDQDEKDDIPFSKIISHLNQKTNSNYKVASKKTKDLIKSRWGEGFTLDDFKTVIDKKTEEWLNDNTMSKYLRPETLFGTKFESYLNQKIRKSKVRKEDFNLEDPQEGESMLTGFG
jgi:uncharacterized phage protein (TIGR02220 family)